MMTVKGLKEILKDWPEEDSHGDPTEVWMETGFELSSQVSTHCRLGSHGDLLLQSNTFENHSDDR